MQGVRVSSGCENRSHTGRYQGGATVETEASLEGERTRKQVLPRAFRRDSVPLTPEFSPEDAFLDGKRKSAFSH